MTPQDVGPFEGFGVGLADFFDELAEHNERDWFKANKHRYEVEVAAPLRSLCAALEGEFGSMKIFRPYRDVRFSADKRPIQEHASAMATSDEGGISYVQVSGEGLLLAGGFYAPTKSQLASFRHLLDSEASAQMVHHELTALAADGFVLSSEGRLKSAPRGYSRHHAEIELLRQTSLAVARLEPMQAWLSTARCLDEVRAAWRVVGGWNRWLLAKIDG